MFGVPLFMVDLHAHTDHSDGVLSPRRLLELAARIPLSALSITDHDTLAGYDAALPYAPSLGVELVCGVELSGRFRGSQVHILGYFLDHAPDLEFRGRLAELNVTRRERNIRLAERLRELGLEVRLEEAERLGRGRIGRPHFARLLLQKGYVSTYREAFDSYLDEGAKGFVERRDTALEEILEWIRRAGGISSWAHPMRFIADDALSAEELFREAAALGLNAVEAFHRDHTFDQAEGLRRAAEKVGLGVTGGSDFHEPSPGGTGLGDLQLPDALLDDLKRRDFSSSARSHEA